MSELVLYDFQFVKEGITDRETLPTAMLSATATTMTSVTTAQDNVHMGVLTDGQGTVVSIEVKELRLVDM